MASRPELQAPSEIFYNDDEALNYTSSSRIIDIRAKLSERAHWSCLHCQTTTYRDNCLILLINGCGSGLIGGTLTDIGHDRIGVDVSESMLNIALEREVEGGLVLADMGQGLGHRSGVLDGANRVVERI